MTQPKFYRENNIITGLYTAGGEFVDSTYKNYVGPYHILPDTTYWKGFNPQESPIQIYKRDQIDFDAEVLTYKSKTLHKVSNYTAPVPYTPNAGTIDYSYAVIQRYFVQSINQPYYNIIEIDIDQYRSINIRNNPGIDGLIWKSTFLDWNLNAEIASIKNPHVIELASKKLPGIRNYLVNILEFTK